MCQRLIISSNCRGNPSLLTVAVRINLIILIFDWRDGILEGIQHITKNNYESFSLPENGKMIALANHTCIDVYTRHKDESPKTTCFK